MPRTAKPTFKLLLACLSLIAVNGILEIGLRIRPPKDVEDARREPHRWAEESCDALFAHDDVRGWRLTPNCTLPSAATTSPEYRITIHSNNHGFRDYRDYRFGRIEGVTRIMVLGDSFGYGNGVEEIARYSNLLDDLLGETVEVYNLAISNYGLDQALSTLQSEGLRYDPDVILLGFSDPMFERLSRKASQSLWSKPFFELDDGALEPSPQPGGKLLAVESLLNRSNLWLFLTRRASAGLGELRARHVVAENAALAAKILERFVELSREAKAALVVFTINPEYTLKRKGATLPDMNRVLEKASESGGFELLDLYPVFESSNYPTLFYPIDQHYTVDGHILVAEQLCRHLRSGDLLPETEPALPCDVDQEAVYRSVVAFKSCSMTDADKALFPRGVCLPGH